MADDNHDDHDHDREIHGFAIPLPAAFAESLAGEHDRGRMQARVAETNIYHFLDRLDVEELLVLRRMLNCDQDSASNNYFDGQVVTLLRVVHQVDITTGERFDTSVFDGDAGAPAVTD